MLFRLSSGNNDLSRRAIFLFALAGAAACALPTIQVVLANAEGVAAQAAERPPENSRIYVNVTVRKDNNELESSIIAVDPATGQWQRIADGQNVVHMRLSPDKSMLVFDKHNDGIWKCAAHDGSERTRIMYTGSQPVWSPDGKQVVAGEGNFDDEKGWKFSSWRCNLDGTDLTKLPIPETDDVSDWSADSQWFVSVSDRHPPKGSGYQLYLMRPDGSQERRLTTDGLNCYPRFSPDGQRVAYLHQLRVNSIWIVNIDGTGGREILKEEEGGRGSFGKVCWSPDGKQLVVHCYDWEVDEKGRKFKTAGVDHDDHLEIIDLDTKNRREVRLQGLRPIHIGPLEWR